MALATWWRNDPLPHLPPLWGFTPDLAADDEEVARVNGLSLAEVRERRLDGHQPYLARLLGQAVGYGWVATRRAEIGELALSFVVPPSDRYLWDFGTLPAWRGQGFYPRLLQSILARESHTAERAWIIYAPENVPSALGIERAGFETVADLSFQRSGRPALKARRNIQRAQAAARLLGVPLDLDPVSACWRCGPGCETNCTCSTTTPAPATCHH